MATDDPPEGGDLTDRVERLESGQSRILGKLDQLLSGTGKAHEAAEEHEERRLDRPSSIEEQVRAELARADEEKAKAAEADADKTERQTIRETLAKLTEVPPRQPQPRRQRAMWGPDR
jgi:hypothetical protein